jgi:hypothetical protein
VRRALSAVAVFLLALALRAGRPEVPPFDDLFHLHRIRTLDLGWRNCPWPPLYDFVCGLLAHVLPIVWLAPFAFAVFCGVIARRVSVTSGAALAVAPYLIAVSHAGSLDHHWTEPMLVCLLLFACRARRMWLLALAIVLSLFVQTALLVACGLAFLVVFVRDDDPVWAARAFALAALVVAVYRIAQPHGYPDDAWYLGWPHVAALTGAAVALCGADTPVCANRQTRVSVALLVALTQAPALLEGLHFFGGEPWLRTIAEFQPLFRHWPTLGDDLANLALAPFLFAAAPEVLLFGVPYLLLAVSSRRFLVPAALPLALAGRKPVAWIAIAAVLAFDLFATAPPPDRQPREIASEVRCLPPGRILGPWWLGHAMHILGEHDVVVDNFGTMTGEARFDNAMDALRQTHPRELLAYCRANGVRYLVLLNPQPHIESAAVCVGVDRAYYHGTRLAQHTVWWRLFRGARIDGFRRISPHVWEVLMSPQEPRLHDPSHPTSQLQVVR